jgi:multidrug efflux pump subunit AcrA (membrane-fusion protein)
VREILVKEAQSVGEGDILFRLEPVQAPANADLLRKQLDAALAQDARLVACASMTTIGTRSALSCSAGSKARVDLYPAMLTCNGT